MCTLFCSECFRPEEEERSLFLYIDTERLEHAAHESVVPDGDHELDHGAVGEMLANPGQRRVTRARGDAELVDQANDGALRFAQGPGVSLGPDGCELVLAHADA